MYSQDLGEMRDNFGVETVEAQIFGKVQRWYTDVGERFDIESTLPVRKTGGRTYLGQEKPTQPDLSLSILSTLHGECKLEALRTSNHVAGWKPLSRPNGPMGRIAWAVVCPGIRCLSLTGCCGYPIG